MPETFVSKSRARKLGQAFRRQLSHREYARKNARINQFALNALRRWSPKSVSVYLASDNEPNIIQLATQFKHRSAQVSCPVVSDMDGKDMIFRSYIGQFNLKRNRWGIKEPLYNHSGKFLYDDDDSAELMFVPLTAFDSSGTRAGMGKGFYDRHLNRLTQKNRRLPYLVGVAFEGQHIDGSIEKDEWDVAMDAIVTERGFFNL